ALGALVDARDDLVGADADHVGGVQRAVARDDLVVDTHVVIAAAVLDEEALGGALQDGVVGGDAPAAQLHEVVARLADAALVDGAAQPLQLLSSLGTNNYVKHLTPLFRGRAEIRL